MQLHLNDTQKELKSHGSYEFPFHTSHEILSSYERGSFSWHWHPEIELTLFLSGEMEYQVNDRVYHMQAGDGLFCNTNALHTGRMLNGQDCHYFSITFLPRLIYGFENSLIHTRFMEPVLTSARLSSVSFSPAVAWEAKALSHLKEIYEQTLHPSPVYELEIQRELSCFWQALFLHESIDLQPSAERAVRDTERLRAILEYLHTHYREKITLDGLAKHVNISKSECCRFFRKHMKLSLFDYLLDYRVEQSLPLLREKDLSITQIAEQTGFGGSAYFAKIFKKEMGISPSQYRKSGRNPGAFS
ncbi:AraC family transcriptional regulator [Lacrimispora saccharolytica]|nr:AraC family transcriptional regulator [Lacrimispora saccharolytica]